MPTYDTIELQTKLTVDVDLDVDENGLLNVIVLLDTDEDRDPDEVAIPFEEIVTDLIEFHKDDMTSEGTRQLYCLAHEFNRMSEKLYEMASMLEEIRIDQD